MTDAAAELCFDPYPLGRLIAPGTERRKNKAGMLFPELDRRSKVPKLNPIVEAALACAVHEDHQWICLSRLDGVRSKQAIRKNVAVFLKFVKGKVGELFLPILERLCGVVWL
jgi:hypothetical protein